MVVAWVWVYVGWPGKEGICGCGCGLGSGLGAGGLVLMVREPGNDEMDMCEPLELWIRIAGRISVS